MPRPAEICAVVVSFHPDEGLAGRLRAILPQVGRVVVVDNASPPAALAPLEPMVAAGEIELVRNRANLGQATALNQGLHCGLERGFPWMLTLDQDTEPDANLVAGLNAVVAMQDFPGRVAIVGANYRQRAQGLENAPGYGVPAWGGAWQEQVATIASGSLSRVEVLDRVGGFCDALFIDWVDFEICLRVRRAGYRVISTAKPLMTHAGGTPTRHRLGGRWRYAHNYSPARLYYQLRNFSYVCREYRHEEPRWLRRCARLTARALLHVLLFEDAKIPKLSAAMRGIFDGLRWKAPCRHTRLGEATAWPSARD